LALWVGGVSALAVTVLELSAWYQPDESIFGLTGEEYSRWSIFPLMLILYGSVGLHRYQEARYGRLGRIGFFTTFIGYSLLFVGEAFAEVMFPLHHPLHTLGGALGGLALPVILAGLGIWGMASLRSRSLPIWAAPAPLAMAVLWFLVRFPLHDFFLDRVPFWSASGVVAQAIIAGGLGLLGLVLWSSDRSSPPPALED
jgi:hypothetical protein